MDTLQRVLERLDLQLNATKTKVVDAQAENFDFLGFTFRLRKSRMSGKVYPHVEPSKRSIQRLKDRIKGLTDHRRCPVPLADVVTEVNPAFEVGRATFTIGTTRMYFATSRCRLKKDLGLICATDIN